MGKKTGGKKREKQKEKTDENSGHYVIASSRPPERRPLERSTLAPIVEMLVGTLHIHLAKSLALLPSDADCLLWPYKDWLSLVEINR